MTHATDRMMQMLSACMAYWVQSGVTTETMATCTPR